MKIYLSGKITGDRNYRRKFNEAAKKLENYGYAVFNPAIMPDGFDYEDYMKIDLMALSACEAIFLLDDWKSSPGAVREKNEADKLGLKVFTGNDFLIRATLLKLCDDTEKLLNFAHEEDTDSSVRYYYDMSRIISYVRESVKYFSTEKTEEENFIEMYEKMKENLKELFFTDFITEGDIQIEYDLDEEDVTQEERRNLLQMASAAKKMTELLGSYINGMQKETA